MNAAVGLSSRHARSNMKIARYICAGSIALVAMQGCSTKPANLDGAGLPDQHLQVQVQVCLPTKRIYFDPLKLDRVENHPMFTKYSEQQLESAPNTIRRVAALNDTRVVNDPKSTRDLWIEFEANSRRNGNFMRASNGLVIRDSTIVDQPVYETALTFPAQDYIGLRVSPRIVEKGREEKMHYWFKLPKAIPTDKFTDWFNPTSMESDWEAHVNDSIWQTLLHGRDMPIFPISAQPPRMRVRLKQRDRHDDPIIDPLPALTTARQIYVSTSKDYVLQFVPLSNVAISNCDE